MKNKTAHATILFLPDIFKVFLSDFLWCHLMFCALGKVQGFANSSDAASCVLPANTYGSLKKLQTCILLY